MTRRGRGGRLEPAHLLVALLLAGCGGAPSTTRSGESAAAAPAPSASPRLEDRAYECAAYNVTRSAGPYPATCDKTGRSVTITFAGNRVLKVGVDDEVTDDGFTFDIHATDAATHDDWNLTVQDK